MQSRYNFANPDTVQADTHRLRFVIKRPDGFRKASSSFCGPVKYMPEDEIVDDGGQRSGLRKSKANSKRKIQPLYDFEDGVDHFLLEAQRALAGQSHTAPPRAPQKPKYRLNRSLSLFAPRDLPPRTKTVTFKDDIIPSSNHHFTLKRKHKDRHEHDDTSKRKADGTTATPHPTTALAVKSTLSFVSIAPAARRANHSVLAPSTFLSVPLAPPPPPHSPPASGPLPFYVAPTPPPAAAMHSTRELARDDCFCVPASATDESPASQ